MDATLLRPIPLPTPDRLVMVWERGETSQQERVSPLNLLDWRERSRAFELVAGYMPNVGGMVLAADDESADTVPRQWVTAGFFDVLGVRPIVGRTFRDSDDRQRSDVVVLSEGFWRSRFGANPGVVSRRIRLDGDPYTVVGVVPDEAQLLARTSVWALFQIHGAPPAARGFYMFRAIGRLKPGVPLDAARSDLSAVAEDLAREFPKTNAGRGVTLEPMSVAAIGRVDKEQLVSVRGVMTLEDIAWERTARHRFRAALVSAFAALAIVLAMVGLFGTLAYSVQQRVRDLAVRRALGATAPDVMRQVILIAARILVAGLAAGLVLSFAASRLLATMLFGVQPLDALTFGGVAAVLALAALAAVAGPAWRATRVDPAVALRAE